MNKQRLEAFTDGVYAIVITLLILDIRIPEVPPAALPQALVSMLPQVFTYVLSFFVVALYWFSHHRVAQQVKLIDGTFVWLNMVWLLFVTVMPFPTALLGRYPLQPLPTAIYGIDLILANVTGFVIIGYMKRHPELCHRSIDPPLFGRQVPVYAVTNGTYAVAVGLAWVEPWVSYLLYAAVLAGLMVRFALIPNPLAQGTTAGDED
ncbi:MAG TPA: TMEM175 family protein [Spirochaetia bacterium]|nr:TMEM175 family protein [Spirochaetia bacterium]